MSKGRFKLRLRGLNELMKSPEMQDVLTEYGQNVMSKAHYMAENHKAEYGMDTKTIRWIAVTTVRAENSAALKENLKNNTLLKALGGSK